MFISKLLNSHSHFIWYLNTVDTSDTKLPVMVCCNYNHSIKIKVLLLFKDQCIKSRLSDVH